MRVEKLLGIAADSQKTGCFDDTLSLSVNSVLKKAGMQVLSEEDLQLVAAGVTIDENYELAEKLKQYLFGGSK